MPSVLPITKASHAVAYVLFFILASASPAHALFLGMKSNSLGNELNFDRVEGLGRGTPPRPPRLGACRVHKQNVRPVF